jgi:hypothetical protein
VNVNASTSQPVSQLLHFIERHIIWG